MSSNWPGTYYVGNSFFANALLITNSGVLADSSGYLGYGLFSSNNSAVVTGTGSVWSNSFQLIVGYDGPGNSLVISNGGRVIDNADINIVGYDVSSSNNSILVTGTGSVWSNSYDLWLGQSGQHNSLVISNGATVIAGDGNSIATRSNSVVVTGAGSALISGIGAGAGNFFVGGVGNNLVISDGGQVVDRAGQVIGTASRTLVTGAGSVWSNGDVYIGENGYGNSLVISNSGLVVNGFGHVGEWSTDSNNSARVTDSGIWLNNTLLIGEHGSSNSLTIAGGLVSATKLTIGVASPNCDNVVRVDSGSLIVSNATHDAVLEVRHGQLILNGGMTQADTLVITNGCASFLHTGGTLIVGNVVLDPNAFRIVSVAQQGNDIFITWMMGPGATNTLQATAGDGNGGFSTNGFTDIFIISNNPTAGTVTNYLDIGGATNTPSRYYRARLVP